VIWRDWIIFAVLCVVWGVPYYFIKIALDDLSPAIIACGRLALGAAILIPIALHRGALRPALRHKRAIAAFAISDLAIPFFLISIAEQWISSSLAGILVATTPLVILFIAPLLGIKERIDMLRTVGLIVGIVGVAVLLGVDPVNGPLGWLGVLCTFIAVIGYAIGPLIVQRHLAGVPEIGALAISLLVAAVALAPFAWLSLPAHTPSMLSIWSVVALGVFCTAIAMLLYFYLIHSAGAARATLVAYICPGVAALLGVLLLDETFGLSSAAGLALILLGSWFASGGLKRGRAHREEQYRPEADVAAQACVSRSTAPTDTRSAAPSPQPTHD
jgi:drug/metabolite transporter (DMT)-like permease